ncbi:hypothetical protein K438DRAFT_1978800 [Mycena galopus ATCC 62051]|nr:hypothetical protein K438DRAFT_1978800 [Mycena galopus ATCC 62051]
MPTDPLDPRLSRTERRDAISRIRDPVEQRDALLDAVLLGLPVYQEKDGEVYGVYRVRYDGDDIIFDPKMGRAGDTTKRQGDYRRKCAPVEFVWVAKYRCACPKAIERLVHLTLRIRGADLPHSAQLCAGCAVHHREFSSFSEAGGILGVLEIAEFWLGALGELVESCKQETNAG